MFDFAGGETVMTGRFITGAIVRDLQAAENIGDRARLGWFDKEFNFYGTAYIKNQEPYYLISSNGARIYDFAQKRLGEDVFCTPTEFYMKKCSVPSGTEDSMAMELKMILAQKLRERYPKDFLQEFQSLFQGMYTDSAKAILEQFQDQIDGLFDEELLKLFGILVEQAYGERKLTRYAYIAFKNWIMDVHADMDDDLIVKDIYHKDLYCLRYQENNQWRIAINAQKERLYSKRFDLVKRHIAALPIYGRTYWYNTDYRLSDARADFEQYLKSDVMEYFFYIANEIQRLPGAVDEKFYQKQSETLLEKYGEAVKDYVLYYAVLWNCIN